ncbi:hypothetical protein GCM10020256_41690 [Streptomyces thermocoprophilus]
MTGGTAVTTGAVGAVGREVEAAEEQRAFRQFAQGLGLAAQPVAEDLGVGTGGGDVLADDDLPVRAFHHGGEGGSADVVVGAGPGQGVGEVGDGVGVVVGVRGVVGRRHAPTLAQET